MSCTGAAGDLFLDGPYSCAARRLATFAELLTSAMQPQRLNSYSAIFGDARACCISGAALTLLVVIAYLLVPLGIAVPDSPSLLLAVLGVVTFFCLTRLEPIPSRCLPLRSLSLLLIGAGVLARILPKSSMIQAGLNALAVTITPEHSLALSTVLLCVGFAFLSGYYMALHISR